MTILCNRTYGMYKHTEEFVEHFGLESHWDACEEEDRTNPEYIEFYRTHARGSIGFCTVPDNATDWVLQEYDGLESVLYVVDGKIHTARCL